MRNKRTKKFEFEDYNEYLDRPFGLKWGVAFAMEELRSTIDNGDAESKRYNPKLERMTREEIDLVLQEAYTYRKPITMQLNRRDEIGRLDDNIEGYFQGIADSEYLYIDGIGYEWEDVINVKII